LTDIVGKELQILTGIKENQSLDISSFADGVYFVRFYAGDKTFTVRVNKID